MSGGRTSSYFVEASRLRRMPFSRARSALRPGANPSLPSAGSPRRALTGARTLHEVDEVEQRFDMRFGRRAGRRTFTRRRRLCSGMSVVVW